ncbi:MAG: hypothetical protein WDM81_20365 [Rhizomicrobium sp.]
MKTVNIALALITVRASAASTGPRPRTLISASMSPPASAAMAGSVRCRAAIATTPIAAMPQKAARQPIWSPAQAASGTPTTLAMVRPMNMAATAAARRFCGTSRAATTEPTPKKAPWFSEVISRAISSMP